jgi:hypothetical protein
MLYSKESFDNLSDEEKATLAFGHLSPCEAFKLAKALDVDIRELTDPSSTVETDLEEDEGGEPIERLLWDLYIEKVGA